MSRILITGGAGFIGSHLASKLLLDGHEVTILDDLSTGSSENLPTQARFIQADVTVPWDEPVDAIYHLACPASPPKYQKDPLQTLRTSYLGTTNMLELARKYGARILFSSTSEVYGDPQVSPQPESYWGNVNSYGPRSCYDEGKRVAETLCYSYAQLGVTVRVARIFNTYGPNMAPDDGRVVSNFLVQALRGDELTIYGDGRQTRSLCYVDDLVRGLEALLAREGNPLESPVNLGNPREMTILELAEMAIKVCDSKSSICYRPLPQDDPHRRNPEISRARQWLGWEPRVTLEEGLKATCEYFKAKLALQI